MQFTVSAAALMAFLGTALAQNPDFDPVFKPESGEEIKPGSTYTIEWEAPAQYRDTTISISLIGGKTQDTQVPLMDIASGVRNADNSYDWSIPADVGGENFYGLVLRSEQNDADWQYSNPFNILAPTEEGAQEDDKKEDSEDSYDAPQVISSGTATVHLSKVAYTTVCPEDEATEIPQPPPANVTSVEVPIYSPPANTSVHVPPPPPVTTLIPQEPEQPAPGPEESYPVEVPEPSAPVEIPESGAASTKAGVFGLVAGLAAVAYML